MQANMNKAADIERDATCDASGCAVRIDMPFIMINVCKNVYTGVDRPFTTMNVQTICMHL